MRCIEQWVHQGDPRRSVRKKWYGASTISWHEVDWSTLSICSRRMRGSETPRGGVGGIRAITSSLLTYRVPQDIAVEQMEPEDGGIRATVRSPSGRSVGRFSVARGRIKSLRMERA